MKTRKVTSAAAGLAILALVVIPGPLFAYKLLGFSLSIGTGGTGYQRDFRLWNNFADPSANNNGTPDSNYPGTLGASMSFWKAGDVWNSNKGGGKNFDFDWETDLPTSTGSSTDNICSALDSGGGCSGGVLAYTIPGEHGWTMRFCDSWTWDDGPGVPPGTRFDIQGVAAHELGHSLGLQHPDFGNEGGPPCNGSCSTNPTMCAFVCDTGYDARTLQQDDKDGLGAIYGTKPGNKPAISSLDGSFTVGQVLNIHGSNFAATGNSVKFTANTTQNTGSIPGVVSNLNSQNGGTLIQVTIPNAALTGNVLVWITSVPVLSNPFPIEVTGGGSPPVINSVSPSNVQAFLGGTVTISGSFFTGATKITVQGVDHTDFTLVDDSTITFSDYTALALGATTATVTTSFGTSNNGNFTYVEDDPPKLAAAASVNTGSPFTWEFATGAFNSVLLVANATGAGVPYGGGTLLFPFFTIASGTTNAIGYKAIVAFIPGGFSGLTFYSQVIDISDLQISNIVSTTIF
ncbi:MAG: hypothetical protein U1E76_01810 [Planctomycetota bacterium]